MSLHQGANLGKGGIDIVPSEERSAPAPPPHLNTDGNAEFFDAPNSLTTDDTPRQRLLPRETGHDIGMGSPVPLSAEAVGVITQLRNMKVS
jgi:hypothetical protein